MYFAAVIVQMCWYLLVKKMRLSCVKSLGQIYIQMLAILRYLVILLRPTREIVDYYFIIGHCRFLVYYLRFIIILPSHEVVMMQLKKLL